MPFTAGRAVQRARAQDVALAVAGCALDVLGFSEVLTSDTGSPAGIVGYAALGYVALLWRRRAPLLVFAVLWVHSSVAAFAIPSYGPVIGLMIAMHAVAMLSPRTVGLWALAATFVPTGFRVATEVAGAPPRHAIAALVASTVLLSLISGGAWSLGRWSRAHREQLDLLARQREHALREAVTSERNRVARDLHDVIAHSVSVMTLQAAGARRVLAVNHDRADQALAAIEGAGAQAMTELRRLLSVLRTTDDPAEPEQSALHPRQGLADLDTLLDGIRAAGVPARLITKGEPRDLDAGVDLSAYRIVQESLTNVAKHAGAGVPTIVTLHWREDDLHLSVTNTEPDRPPTTTGPRPAGGHGLLGLRERAVAVGGHLDSGQRPGGGFHVTAALPAPSSSPAEQQQVHPWSTSDVTGSTR